MSEPDTHSYILLFGKRAVEQFQKEDVDIITPRMADNYLSMLSGYSAQLEEELGRLEMEEAKSWKSLRTSYKTNAEADRAWQGTTEGLRQIELKYTLKAVDKIIAACKRRLDRFKMEAINLH